MTKPNQRDRRTICVVTGSRAEFGLLRPVMRAVEKHSLLRLQVVAAGSHFLPPARTIREVEAEFDVAVRVKMQEAGKTARAADAAALGRGVQSFTRAFTKIKPDWVLVLGDRIEAFAAASAASVGGWALAHIHGGDRAEGIADEAMRHAITKLAHLHLPATRQSAMRIVQMGEPRNRVHVVGSPAVDGLRQIKAMSDAEAEALGDPRIVVLLHPSGLTPKDEATLAGAVADGIAFVSSRVLVLAPNHDPGREIIVRALRPADSQSRFVEHLPRERFVALMKRLASRERGGMLVGNSSAGLIEAAAIGLPVVNVGPRQNGRERARNVIDVSVKDGWSRTRIAGMVAEAILLAGIRGSARGAHPYGDGRSGERVARLLRDVDPGAPGFLRKRNTF